MVNNKTHILSPRKIYFSAFLTGLTLAYLIFSHAPSIGAYVVKLSAPYLSETPSNFSDDPKSDQALINKIQNLKKRHQKFTPKIPYLIISTSDNRISLMKKRKLMIS